jgi:hypothetical protein
MRVRVTVSEIELGDDRGNPIDSIEVICSRCDHRVEVYGTGERSIKRGCVMLREECPQGEDNFYHHADN